MDTRPFKFLRPKGLFLFVTIAFWMGHSVARYVRSLAPLIPFTHSTGSLHSKTSLTHFAHSLLEQLKFTNLYLYWDRVLMRPTRLLSSIETRPLCFALPKRSLHRIHCTYFFIDMIIHVSLLGRYITYVDSNEMLFTSNQIWKCDSLFMRHKTPLAHSWALGVWCLPTPRTISSLSSLSLRSLRRSLKTTHPFVTSSFSHY